MKSIIAISLKRNKRQFIFAFLFGVITSISTLISMVLVQQVFDILIYNYNKDIILYITLLVVLIFANLLSNIIFQYNYRLLDNTGSFPIRIAFFTSMMKKNYKSNDLVNSGSIITSVTEDSEKLSKIYTSQLVGTIILFIQFLVTIILMCVYNIKMTFIILIFVFTGLFITSFVSKRMAETVSDIQKESGVERYQIIQSLNGLKTIKQLQKEDYFVKQYDNILSNKTKLSKKYSMYYTIYFCTFTFINNILPFIVVLLGVYFVMNNEVSIGAIIIMQSLVNSLPEPILSIADFYNSFNISKALVKKNKELIDSNSIGENESQLFTPKFEKLNLMSKGMKFKDKKVLVGTTIEINKGEIVVIRGHSGVGKTTLLNLISRFLDYNKEFISIKYNNHELLDFSYPSYYEKVLLVEQNVITVNDTLLENICLGEVYSNEFLNEIIEVSQLNDFISEKGFDFVINEEARNISGGERQRIGLARMLIRKPEILLLDEPTSALDNETSVSLVNKLKLFALKYNITIVVVSHKDDFEKVANIVIKL